jgi:hypothetical protein
LREGFGVFKNTPKRNRSQFEHSPQANPNWTLKL